MLGEGIVFQMVRSGNGPYNMHGTLERSVRGTDPRSVRAKSQKSV